MRVSTDGPVNLFGLRVRRDAFTTISINPTQCLSNGYSLRIGLPERRDCINIAALQKVKNRYAVELDIQKPEGLEYLLVERAVTRRIDINFCTQYVCAHQRKVSPNEGLYLEICCALDLEVGVDTLGNVRGHLNLPNAISAAAQQRLELKKFFLLLALSLRGGICPFDLCQRVVSALCDKGMKCGPNRRTSLWIG
jgi:hypothetical protein